MDCPTCESLVDAYLDGELSATQSAEFEQALPGCPHCATRLEEARVLSSLLRDLPADTAPDLLRARIDRELRAIGAKARPASPRQSMPRQPMRWMAMAASLIVAVSIGWMGGTLSTQGGRDRDELVASYLRVASSEHTVDVVSSDRHTVKPWFGGRIDVFDGRKVSVLVYRRNQHKVALTLLPTSSASGVPVSVTQRDGFVMGQWRHGGFEMRAVSAISPAEMESFASALDRAVDADR